MTALQGGGPAAARHSAGSSASRGCRAPRRRRAVAPAAAAGGGPQPDPYAVLQVPRGASRRAIRSAYIGQIKLLHPDVSAPMGEDTTAAAAALNAAYESLMAGFDSNSRDDDDDDEEPDPFEVFDLPEAEPDRLFVNPFACYNISPLQWQEVQAVAREAEAAGREPWMALQQAGVRCEESALCYLSPRQLELLGAELDRACAALDATSLDVAAFFVADCLARARLANARMPAGAGRW